MSGKKLKQNKTNMPHSLIPTYHFLIVYIDTKAFPTGSQLLGGG